VFTLRDCALIEIRIFGDKPRIVPLDHPNRRAALIAARDCVDGI
jgi:hypothetical protein